jgi:predicted AlkP superfamily phosphohydrolase/phosphomutase
MKPLLVFGLDGCSPTTMRDYVAANSAGLFAGIANQGLMTTLFSTWPYFTAPAWTTFATGLGPSWHGMYHWRGRYDTDLGLRPLISSEHLARATFWAWVQDNGGRVAVSNFPMEYPAPAISGRYICGTLAAEDADNTTWPHAVAARLRVELPEFRFEMDKGLSYMDRPVELREHIDEVGDNHYAAMRRYCSGRFDLFCHVVTVTDRMQHFFWNHHDPSHPLAQSVFDTDPVFDTYARAEAELAELWGSGDYANLLVLSDHGMGASNEAFHTDTWLVENGFAVAGTGGKVDIERSVAYSAEEPECAVYVNRADRDEIGLSSEDYEALIVDLIDALMRVRRPDGSSAFREVHDVRTLGAGPKVGHGPDIILYPSHGLHPRPGLAPGVFSEDARLMAGHRPEGLLMLIGDDVPNLGDFSSPERIDMADVFPLMCQLMELPQPQGLHGRIRPELCSAPPPVGVELDWATRVGSEILRQGESISVTRRLRELGYSDA